MEKNLLVAALIGGLFSGILGAIPVFNLANVCCLLWAWLGTFLAVRLYSRASSPSGVCTLKKALLIGVLTALIAGILWPILVLGMNFIGLTSYGEQFQVTAKSINFEKVLKDFDEERQKLLLERMEAFCKMSPQEALTEFVILFAPLYLLCLLIVSPIAGMVGALLFGANVAPMAEEEESKAASP